MNATSHHSADDDDLPLLTDIVAESDSATPPPPPVKPAPAKPVITVTIKPAPPPRPAPPPPPPAIEIPAPRPEPVAPLLAPEPVVPQQFAALLVVDEPAPELMRVPAVEPQGRDEVVGSEPPAVVSVESIDLPLTEEVALVATIEVAEMETSAPAVSIPAPTISAELVQSWMSQRLPQLLAEELAAAQLRIEAQLQAELVRLLAAETDLTKN
jgi:hypothetical protein